MKIILKIILITLILNIEFSFAQDNRNKIDSIPKYDVLDNGTFLTIQIGIWQPLLNLSEIYNFSPTVGVKFGYPILSRVRLQAGVRFVYPKNSNFFNYSTKDTSFTTKSEDVGFLGIWISDKNKLNKNFMLDKYLGLGINSLSTDVEDPKSKKDNKFNYSVETINFNFGVCASTKILKKRLIGVFLEFNYAPYSLLSEKVNNNFGSSSFSYGLSIGL
jgi:hypothetical protein